MPKIKADKQPRSKQPTKKRRQYNSPLRQQQSAETRERIIAAGSDIVHNLPAWDWTNLTARAVGERAGVSERTVHRYYSTERKLRDAVVQRLMDESGIPLDYLELDDFADTTATMFSYLASFAIEPATVTDPSFESIDQTRRDSLLQAVVRATPDLTQEQHLMVAASLDIFWSPPIYERMIAVWGLEPSSATGVINWLIGLVQNAIRDDQFPRGGG